MFLIILPLTLLLVMPCWLGLIRQKTTGFKGLIHLLPTYHRASTKRASTLQTGSFNAKLLPCLPANLKPVVLHTRKTFFLHRNRTKDFSFISCKNISIVNLHNTFICSLSYDVKCHDEKYLLQHSLIYHEERKS